MSTNMWLFIMCTTHKLKLLLYKSRSYNSKILLKTGNTLFQQLYSVIERSCKLVTYKIDMYVHM